MSEHDAVFESGRWRGFYVYQDSAVRHRMELDLAFRDGRVRGDGNDGIGDFTIDGSYDETALEVHWSKRYVGRHTVLYRGFREGVGIWGTWEIPPGWRGGFRIWPQGFGEGESLVEREAIEEPAVLVRRPGGNSR